MTALCLATPDHAGLIVGFMHKLGEFQKMSSAITVTAEKMKELLQNKDGESVLAFAYFCKHSSAFIGHTCLYIDAFYVEENFRKQGIGKQIMRFLAKLCKERGYARMEWGCLDWNAGAWNFYTNLGSVPFETLTIHRLSGESLEKLTQ